MNIKTYDMNIQTYPNITNEIEGAIIIPDDILPDINDYYFDGNIHYSGTITLQNDAKICGSQQIDELDKKCEKLEKKYKKLKQKYKKLSLMIKYLPNGEEMKKAENNFYKLQKTHISDLQT